MAQSLGLYYQHGFAAQTQTIKAQIEAVFPHLTVTMLGPLALMMDAWDTAAGHYDVHYLLASLQASETNTHVLWFVTKEIGDVWHDFLFGASDGSKAIVSAAWLEDEDDIVKEACHEVGHLLGLGHCSNNCFMRTSWTIKSVQNKSGDLCQECRCRLETIKLRC